MKKLLIISYLLTIFTFAAEQKAEEWKVNGRLNMYFQTIDVQNDANSTRDGDTHNEELNLNATKLLENGKVGVESRFRNTNNERIQTSDTELLYLRTYYHNKIWNLEAGDVATSLNPYIFSGSLKGFKSTYKSPKKEQTWNYTVIGGYKKTSWKELYSTEANEEPTGYASAFKAKYIHKRSQNIALSLATLDTDLSTGDSNSTQLGKRGIAIGIDGKWRFSKSVTLKGRTALSHGTDDIKNNKASSSNGAIYLKLLTRPVLKSVKSNFTYQRVASNFVSFGGNGNKDKEQLENSTTWKINKQYRARIDLKTNRDNLNGALSDTRNLYYESLMLTYYPEFIKRANVNFKVSNKDIDGRGANNNKQTINIDFNIRKKDGWRYGTGYNYNDYTDHNATASSQTIHTIKALVGYKKNLSKISSYRFTIKPSYHHIKNNEKKIGLKVDTGYIHDKQLSMNLLYMTNQTNNSTTNDTTNTTYQFRTKYKLDIHGKNVVRLLLEKRDVDVENNMDSSYNEYIGKISFIANF